MAGARVVEDSYRLFSCARCHQPVRICAYCDRGNIYCGDGCSELRRRGSLRRAGQRYQGTRRGRHLHAARQARYRERQASKSLGAGFVLAQQPGGVIRVPDAPEFARPLWIVTHNDLRNVARIRAFLRLVGDRIAAQLAGQPGG